MITKFVRRLDSDSSIKNCRSPLIRFATDETVKFIKATMSGPTIERSGNGDLPRRRFVILPKGGGTAPIQPQHLRMRCHTLCTDSGISGKRSGEFHNRPGVVHVMIASR